MMAVRHGHTATMPQRRRGSEAGSGTATQWDQWQWQVMIFGYQSVGPQVAMRRSAHLGPTGRGKGVYLCLLPCVSAAACLCVRTLAWEALYMALTLFLSPSHALALTAARSQSS